MATGQPFIYLFLLLSCFIILESMKSPIAKQNNEKNLHWLFKTLKNIALSGIFKTFWKAYGKTIDKHHQVLTVVSDKYAFKIVRYIPVFYMSETKT